MQCYYDVLEVPFGSQPSSEELRRQYKKLALRYHPDKNVGNENESTARFMELNHAYSILSDSRQKRWYDEHREEMLRASSVASVSERLRGRPVDIWPLFSYRFDATNFFKKFGAVFLEIHDAEIEGHVSGVDDPTREGPPPFGDETSHGATVREFYSYWSSFSSALTFAWEDIHDTTEAPNRAVRRYAQFLSDMLSSIIFSGFLRQTTRNVEIRVG